jgi:glycosyltransferase involved in cell wall biosynthesis
VKFAIITHVPHQQHGAQYFAYAPYVREMNVWFKYVDEVIVVAPLEPFANDAIDMPYAHPKLTFVKAGRFDLLTFGGILKSLWRLPRISWQIFRAMQKADHIHLRNPGNIGLVGCFIQILFPAKPKTAKYAGNWDPNAKQPWSYKWQRKILSNTLFTKNMQVLVYGQWPGSTSNVKPFFTATYREADKIETPVRSFSDGVRFLFVGTLSPGKRPLYAIQLVQELIKAGHRVTLDFYGEGAERHKMEAYITQNRLEDFITLHGNRRESDVRKAYQTAHFLLLPSQSEGWPKVVAEAMFWGCFPIATGVSCVPYMLDHGNRGLLLTMNRQVDFVAIAALLDNPETYRHKISKSMEWSREYTLDLFENQIKALLSV